MDAASDLSKQDNAHSRAVNYSLFTINFLRPRMPRLFQRVLHFRWHVGFIVLGQHFLGFKAVGADQGAIGDDALPFAEQVRQDALIIHPHRVVAVGDLEAHGELIATLSDPLGTTEVEITAPCAGLIIGRTVLPIVNEGDAVVHIAAIIKRRNEEPMVQPGEALSKDPPFDEDEIL